ncbi:superoxide dismutase family protein [Chryseobacterium fluminis]|uniref:superoxide dismutase family protein n=1 Tax=Chryseobacterium fluminis TaxID=2983606 RepID=UPI00224D33C2|nr:superoxide dismutase family protein [Chryseobacterium sp. MMS21-Ot14]UZT96384.1 superoxide dismutase family protein [Chryseobacterium sp. MMS21-Ot14]
MKVQTLALLAGCALFAVSCGTTKTYSVLAKSNTQTGGTAKFMQKGDDVIMKLDVTNLTPGIHAVHIHEKGDCSAADGTSTGGHWNPAKDDHGKWGAEHFHMGDIGNLTADQSGNATLTFKTDKWCLGCADESKNIIGKGIIVHAAADDFHTQPTGNAGGRVGCVEIK